MPAQQNNPNQQNTDQTKKDTELQIAANPNPRANENIRHTPFDEKNESRENEDVGSEITDGEDA